MTDRKPEWLKIKFQTGENNREVREVLLNLSLNTVCEEANCPNQMECFSRRTATFMILGKVCTRNCTFCNVAKGIPQPVDNDEPLRVAQAAKALQLKHVVVTSVTRDDLPDGGAGHFARTVAAVRQLNPDATIEVLIPDFKGDSEALRLVVEAGPEVINHNVETVPRLYTAVRPRAVYRRSLQVLAGVKKMEQKIKTKSGIMVGLGEEEREVIEVFADLLAAGCDFLTIGQYLAPSREHHPVVEYVTPEIFTRYREIAKDMGFKEVASSPLVRSSYHAGQMLKGSSRRSGL